MIPTLLLALMPQRRLVAPEVPAWVARVLRDSPPSPPYVYADRPSRHRPDGSVVLEPGEVYTGIESLPVAAPGTLGDSDVMNLQTAKFIARGDYERAYQAQEVGHSAHEMISGDLFAYAALLTGRYADAQDLLVRYLRRHAGGMNDYETALSAAVSLRGQVYPGQGASVLEALRGRLQDPEMVRLVPNEAPKDPAGVALLSLVALGVGQQEPAYLEWALRLAPRCEVAAWDLVVMYHARSGHGADASRVAAAMLRNLPAGPARNGFVGWLKRWDVRPAAASAKP